jgi:hypothetical protein
MTDREAMTWTVRVSSRDRQRATVYARKRSFEVGPPLAIDVEDERTSAFEYLLGAIGADLVAGMKLLCHRRRLEVDNVEALIHGELNNALAHLAVVGEEGHPGLERLTIKVFVETLEEDDDVRKVWDEMLQRSPLYRTFSSIAHFDLKLEIVM